MDAYRHHYTCNQWLEETDCSLAIKARERKVTRGLKGGGRKSRSEGKKKKKKTKGRRQRE